MDFSSYKKSVPNMAEIARNNSKKVTHKDHTAEWVKAAYDELKKSGWG